jgi:hypothetical protein
LVRVTVVNCGCLSRFLCFLLFAATAMSAYGD